jgi:hypothetical protein
MGLNITPSTVSGEPEQVDDDRTPARPALDDLRRALRQLEEIHGFEALLKTLGPIPLTRKQIARLTEEELLADNPEYQRLSQ